MREYKIALDVDDCLAGFYPAMCKKFNRPEFQVDIWDAEVDCKWVAQKFPELYNNIGFWKHLPILSDPNSITFDVDCYITALPNSLGLLRKCWLNDNGFPDRPLICETGSKVDIMQSRGIDVLIDDKPSTIRAVREAGLVGIQFVPAYMNNYDRNDPHTIRHLSEVTNILNNL